MSKVGIRNTLSKSHIEKDGRVATKYIFCHGCSKIWGWRYFYWEFEERTEEVISKLEKKLSEVAGRKWTGGCTWFREKTNDITKQALDDDSMIMFE